MALIGLQMTCTTNRVPRTDGPVGTVYGTVESKAETVNVPLRRRVHLYSNQGELLATTLSRSADGVYEFRFLDVAALFTVMVRDVAKDFAPVCHDNLKPELKR